MASREQPPLVGRREAIAVLGAGGLGAVLWRGSALAWAACAPSPQQTAGPFHVENALVRRDITEDRAGLRLKLRLTVRDATTCAPIEGADVELWHCDAAGVYSGVGGVPDASFLRGHQPTDRRGKVRFQTIYPGWYPGRTPHIHVSVRVDGAVAHTGQLYFDDEVTAAVYRRQPYAGRGAAGTTNASDGIYARGGAQSMLALRKHRRSISGTITLVVGA
jgi:protocatechuate 3,4-dioxygenase beta subunit